MENNMQAFMYVGKWAIMGQDKWERAILLAPVKATDEEILPFYDKLGGYIAEVVEVEKEDDETGDVTLVKDFRKVKTGRFFDFKKNEAKDEAGNVVAASEKRAAAAAKKAKKEATDVINKPKKEKKVK